MGRSQYNTTFDCGSPQTLGTLFAEFRAAIAACIKRGTLPDSDVLKVSCEAPDFKIRGLILEKSMGLRAIYEFDERGMPRRVCALNY
ncbi:MAG TPA: hypothetical protein VFB45_04575 [Pseudolabrys sp.]|nr:hypothetical protein [Pseudolabrys sp.]